MNTSNRPGGLENHFGSTVELFGLNFQKVNFETAVSGIVKESIKLKPTLLITPNVDHIVMIHRNQSIREIFKSAHILVADGMPIVWLSGLIPGKKIPERITGADLMPAICHECAIQLLSVAIIGGKPGVAEKAVARLKEVSPKLEVKGVFSPPLGFEKNQAEIKKMVQMCNDWKPNVLFLCLGTPKQEKWAHENIGVLDCGVIACVGAAADMLAGEVMRAPKWIRNSGFEWLWRLALEPRRLWKRYLVDDTAFLYYGARELWKQWRAKK